MWNPDEPDIFGGAPAINNGFQEAQADLKSMSEEEFQYHYKAEKTQYSALVKAIDALRTVNSQLQEMVALNIDSEISENTAMLIDDYVHLLEQMHMASYWEREGR